MTEIIPTTNPIFLPGVILRLQIDFGGADGGERGWAGCGRCTVWFYGAYINANLLHYYELIAALMSS